MKLLKYPPTTNVTAASVPQACLGDVAAAVDAANNDRGGRMVNANLSSSEE
jgi:hypothetical protein